MIKWSIIAKNDIVAIAKYFKDKSLESATNIINTIFNMVSRLNDFPLSGRLREETGTREIVINKYPYIVSYIIKENDIIIVRVLHSRMLPRA